MANLAKGEVELSLDDGSTRILKFATNEICALEQHLEVESLNELIELMQPKRLKMQTLRAFMWAALQKHQPGTTLEDAGDIISALGQVQSQNLVVMAMNAGMPAGAGTTEKKTT